MADLPKLRAVVFQEGPWWIKPQLAVQGTIDTAAGVLAVEGGRFVPRRAPGGER